MSDSEFTSNNLIVSGEYGTRYPPYYFLMPSYWKPRKTAERKRSINMTQRAFSHEEDIEPVPQGMEDNVAMR